MIYTSWKLIFGLSKRIIYTVDKAYATHLKFS